MVFVINGYPQSGKDSFVEYVRNQWNIFKYNHPKYKSTEIINISTIDYLKEIFKENFNWTGEKTPEVRNALATIHKALMNWNDLPFVLTSSKIKEEILKGNIVFLHCREPYNIDKYVKQFNATTIFIDNQKAKKELLSKYSTNLADTEVENYKYDIIINNNNSLIKLKEQAKNFIFETILTD